MAEEERRITPCPTGVKNETNIIALFAFKDDIKKTIKDIYDKVGEVRDMLMKRPSWIVTLVISILMMACGSLFTAVIMLMKELAVK